jgi:hypothetical protein
MGDQPQNPSKPIRPAPPPFVGRPSPGALSPTPRPPRPTLPPFSPPFAGRPSPAVPTAPSASAPEPSWFDEEPNEASGAAADPREAGIQWVNPDEPSASPPSQAATGIDWLDAPSPAAGAPTSESPPSDDADDVFGWDPAEERAGALDAPRANVSLDTLKELEPWASPGAESAISNSEDLAAVLESVAARIRSGDLFVPGASTATDEAALASVLAALLQRGRG